MPIRGSDDLRYCEGTWGGVEGGQPSWENRIYHNLTNQKLEKHDAGEKFNYDRSTNVSFKGCIPYWYFALCITFICSVKHQ